MLRKLHLPSPRFIFVVFLFYTWSLLYIYNFIESNTAVRYILFVSTGLVVLCLYASEYRRRYEFGLRSLVFAHAQNDWRLLFTFFAVCAPISAWINGSVFAAAGVSLLGLMIIVITSVRATDSAPFAILALFGLSLIGSVASYHIGDNPYGYLPWHERQETFVGLSRVSLFPSLADSALFSVAIILYCIYFRFRGWHVVLAAGAYFIYFSYSRTAIAALGVALASAILARLGIRGTLNFIIVVAALVLSTGFADKLVPALVSAERAVRGGDSFVEARFVRSVSPLYQDGTPIPDEIWAQTEEAKNAHLGSRAALWRDHVGAFLSSPLIGAGRDGAIAALQQRSLDSSKTGSESFFTRILAEFGIIGLLFWAAVWRLFVHFDRMDSAAGRSLTVAFTAILALYGSSALPYSFTTLAFIALIGKALSHDGHRGATRHKTSNIRCFIHRSPPSKE